MATSSAYLVGQMRKAAAKHQFVTLTASLATMETAPNLSIVNVKLDGTLRETLVKRCIMALFLTGLVQLVMNVSAFPDVKMDTANIPLSAGAIKDGKECFATSVILKKKTI